MLNYKIVTQFNKMEREVSIFFMRNYETNNLQGTHVLFPGDTFQNHWVKLTY